MVKFGHCGICGCINSLRIVGISAWCSIHHLELFFFLNNLFWTAYCITVGAVLALFPPVLLFKKILTIRFLKSM